MFKNLKILPYKVLKECTLPNLGRINIICGKNNSGKSTLLGAINNDKSRLEGLSINEKEIERIKFHGVSWDINNPGYKSKNDDYLRILKEVAIAKDMWFPNLDDKEGFTMLFLDKSKSGNSLIRNDVFYPAPLTTAYEGLFEKHSTILLPPKRHMATLQNIDTSEDISPTGQGILNYLFFAKNQGEFSDNGKIFKEINKAFTQISSGYSFDLQPEKHNALRLKFSFNKGGWINAEDCGLGLQELIIVLYFAIHPKYDVLLIEEPENHLHPDMQRKLLYFLREGTEKQYFITTHSNIFLNNALIDRVFFTSFKNHSIIVDDATNRASILNDLGYSITDNLVSDLIILVEGPKDKGVIEEFLIKKGLHEYDIKIWPLGGDIMAESDLSVFAEKYNILGLIDKDPGSNVVRTKFKEKCGSYRIEVHTLERYSIENYFSLRVLRKVFGSQISSSITEIAKDKKLEDQIKIDVKKNNHRLAKEMTLDEIKDTDLYEFLNKVEKKCKESFPSA